MWQTDAESLPVRAPFRRLTGMISSLPLVTSIAFVELRLLRWCYRRLFRMGRISCSDLVHRQANRDARREMCFFHAMIYRELTFRSIRKSRSE